MRTPERDPKSTGFAPLGTFRLQPQCVIDALAYRIGGDKNLTCGVRGCTLQSICRRTAVGTTLSINGNCAEGKTLRQTLRTF